MKIIRIIILLLIYTSNIQAQIYLGSMSQNGYTRQVDQHKSTSISQSDQPNKKQMERTTYLGGPAWYDLWDCNFVPGGFIRSYAWPIYPDSNIIDNYSPVATLPYKHIQLHGMGVSFDPTDSNYGPYAVSYWTPYWAQYDSNTYYVDSLAFYYHYIRNNLSAIGDSMVVEVSRSQIVSIPDSGCQKYQLGLNSLYSNICKDSLIRFASMRYDNSSGNPNDCLDSVIMPQTIAAERFAISLDSILRDTVTGTQGDNYLQVPLNGVTGMPIIPGTNMVVYVYFKSGINYPPGTLLSTANCIYLYAGNPRGGHWFGQSAHNTPLGLPGSYQTVLVANDETRYNDTGFAFNGHNVLIPTGYFARYNDSESPGFDVMGIKFLVSDSSGGGGSSTKIRNAISMIITDIAYPNPAANNINIDFHTEYARETNISIIDLYGHKMVSRLYENTSDGVAEFNISALPNGVYLYEIMSGNERSMGHFEVLH